MAWIIEDTYDGEQFIADIVKNPGGIDIEIIYTKIKDEAMQFFLPQDAKLWVEWLYGSWSEFFKLKQVPQAERKTA